MLTAPLDTDTLRDIPSPVLAAVGDSVYDLMVRVRLASRGICRIGELHSERVAWVNAPAQARAIKHLMPLLTEEESAVFRRGRNAELGHIPAAATRGEYHAATGLEALWGWLYLKGDMERLSTLFAALTDTPEDGA